MDPTAYLAPYVDAGGGVHTFRELSFGTWTDAHDDVAANAGLALLTTPQPKLIAARIQRRLVSRFPGETFWWSTQTYAPAWTVRFLDACSGGLPLGIRKAAQAWIGGLPESSSGFEVAHQLLAALAAGTLDDAAVPFVNRLLDLAAPQGWPGSSFLLVPDREAGSQTAPHPESRGLLTTALCVQTLSEWLGLGLHPLRRSAW